MVLVFSLCESTSLVSSGKLLSVLPYWYLASLSSALTSTHPIAFFPLGHSTMAQGKERDSVHSVAQQQDAFPEVWGPLLTYLSLTEKIRLLSHSRHLLRCLLLGLAHNFGYRNLLQASLLQWFAEYFDTFALGNGKTGVNFCLLICWRLVL